jgi:hypothetical protein
MRQGCSVRAEFMFHLCIFKNELSMFLTVLLDMACNFVRHFYVRLTR